MAGSKLMTFDQWHKWALGKLIDIDGWYGAQCWDAFADYAMRTAGAPKLSTYTSGNAGLDTSLVSSIWTKFPARAGIDNYYVRVSKTEKPRKGDVAIWGRSAPFPYSHIGMATGRTKAGSIEVLSQNLSGNANTASGAVVAAYLTTNGLLGYLRPKTSVAPSKKGKEVIAFHREDKTARKSGRIIKPGAGLYLHTSSNLPSQATNLIGGVGQYSITWHLYAEGKPGDVVQVVLIRQTNPGKKNASNSNHYVEKMVIPADGKIHESREFKLYAGGSAPVAIYARAYTDKKNTGDVKITLFDSDAFLFTS